MESIKLTFRDEIIKVDDLGNAAWVTFFQDGTLISNDHITNISGIRVTWGMVKRNEKWVIVQTHYSVPPEKSAE